MSMPSSPQPGSPQQPGQQQVPPGPPPQPDQQQAGAPQQPYQQQGAPGGPQQPGQAGPSAAPAKKPSKAPKILIIIGAIILVVSVVGGILTAVLSFVNTLGVTEEFETYPEGSGAYVAEADEEVMLYVDEDMPPPNCEVIDPQGASATLTRDRTRSVSTGSESWESFGKFTAQEAGEYEIVCDGGPIAVGPPLSVGGILLAVGGLIGGIGGGFIGLVLLIVGIVLVMVRRRKA